MPAMSSRGRGRRTINEINMVPFIDVMLVLLIIFMVTAPLITPSVINLPTVDRANKQPDKPIEIVIKSDDEVQIKKDPAKHGGKPLSIIGIVLGGAYFVFLAFIILIYGLSFLAQGLK